jgi:hypothetical protein
MNGGDGNGDMRLVDPRTMVSMFRSKQDIYDFLKFMCKSAWPCIWLYVEGYLLPTYKRCPLSFLRDCMSKQKLLLKSDEARTINIPRYAEVSMKSLIKDAYRDPLVSMYLPDYENEDMTPDKEYFFTVMSSLRYEYTKEIVNGALVARNSAQEKAAEDLIAIHKDFYNDIENSQWVSSKFAWVSSCSIEKRGKGVHLLKSGAKLVIKNRKKPRKLERKGIEDWFNENEDKIARLAYVQLEEEMTAAKHLEFSALQDKENIATNETMTELTTPHRLNVYWLGN